MSRRRRTVRRRRAALAGGIAAALVAVAVVSCWPAGDDGSTARTELVRAYLAAWAREDYPRMHELLTPGSRKRVPLRRFAAFHREALAVATATAGPRLVAAEIEGETVRVTARVPTAAFGPVQASLVVPVTLRERHRGIVWTTPMAFPGLRRGERLRAETRLPPRATLLAADGRVLAEGEQRTPDPEVADVASETVGVLDAIEPDRADDLQARGVPSDARVGRSGLERALDGRLVGRPGGRLLAGPRVLARRAPRQAPAVRTTIVPAVVRSAVSALGGRMGGAVAIDPRTGAVLGYSGVPFSGLRAPGSTFKIVTLVAALTTRVTDRDATFPFETAANLGGAPLQNHDGAACGGSLVESFADSCNSVFAPLGAEVGADGLAQTARRFGFDAPADIPGAAMSTIPGGEGGTDPLTVGSTAIGQGKVLATALQMTSVAVTVARDGIRPRLTLDGDAAARSTGGKRVMSTAVARTVQDAMRAVVTQGTGTGAALEDVPVAGKTGTAELGLSCTAEVAATGECDLDDPTDTDAWFVGYAPAGKTCLPRAAVGIVLMENGAGGDTAAPAARELLRAALDAPGSEGTQRGRAQEARC